MADAYTELGVPSDPQDAKLEMETDLATRIPGWLSVPGSLIDQAFETVALQVARIGAALEDAALEAFIGFGQSIVQLPMLVDEHAYGTVTFTATDTNGRSIPAGTTLVGDDGAGGEVIFQTTQDALIEVGATEVESVPIEAVDPGRLPNAVSGALTMSSSIDGELASVVLDADTTVGETAETVEEYADRLATRLQLLTDGVVTPDDYDLLLRTSLTAVYRVLVRDKFDPGVNEIQTISTTGTPSSGSFTLTYSGQTTAAIAYNANAATIQTRLEALSNIAVGDVSVTGGALPTTPVVVEFTGALERTNVATMTVTDSITGGDAVVTVTRSGAADASDVAGALTISMIDSSGAWVGSGVDSQAEDLIEEHRETGATVTIVAPTTTAIDVDYEIIVEDDYDDAEVIAAVDEALEAFLDPSAWGQPRTGDEPAWVLKDVLRPMGMLGPVIGNVEGVESVEEVLACVAGGTPAASNITLDGDAPLTSAGTITGSAV